MSEGPKLDGADLPSVPLPAHKSSAPPWPAAPRWQKPLYIPFLLLTAVNVSLLFLRVDLGTAGRWLESLMLLAAAAASLVSLAQRLPLQNVLMAAVLIYCWSGGILALGVATAIPFGPIVFLDKAGPQLFGVVPWPLPLLWILVIVSGRGVARLIMRPWRKTNFYGYWVISLTCALAVIFDLALEPFAVTHRYWFWLPTHAWIHWHSAPWVNFLGWLVTAFTVMAMTLPWLINKQPVKRPKDYWPLFQWLILLGYLICGNFLNGHLTAAIVCLAATAAVSVMAVRGARW